MNKMWITITTAALLAGSPLLASAQAAPDFTTFHQTFDEDTESWMSKADEGATGWCGSIERVDRKALDAGGADILPSSGSGYALVTHGACNDFYSESFPDGSAPGSSGMERFATSGFPKSGYVNALDIYLDPDWPDGTGFGYAVSFQVVDEEFPNFRYMSLQVAKSDGALMVGSHEILEAGWYTFEHIFQDAAGSLHVTLNLTKRGWLQHSESVAATMFTGEDIASFSTANTSNGYIWFTHISEGLALAIDEEQIRIGLEKTSPIAWAGLTGPWYDPETNGQGWNFIATSSGVFGYFYGYSEAGDPLWLITEKAIDDITAGEPITYNLLHGSGGSFSAPVLPGDLAHWGEVTLTFDNCQQAVAEISGVDGTETHQLVRITDTTGLENCGL